MCGFTGRNASRSDTFPAVTSQRAEPGVPAPGVSIARRSGVSRAVAVLGLAAGALFALSPVHVHELGTDINCGLGPVAMNQQPYADGSNATEVQMCRHEGAQRVFYGGGIAVVALISAAALRRR